MRQKRMQGVEEGMDGGGGSLMCFTFLHEWNQSGGANVWSVGWWLVFRDIMTICGSQKKECELFAVLTLTIHCLCGHCAPVQTRGARAPPKGSFVHCSALWRAVTCWAYRTLSVIKTAVIIRFFMLMSMRFTQSINPSFLDSTCPTHALQDNHGTL